MYRLINTATGEAVLETIHLSDLRSFVASSTYQHWEIVSVVISEVTYVIL
jgi:hypothetical protein